jgi:hypothetical protein
MSAVSGLCAKADSGPRNVCATKTASTAVGTFAYRIVVQRGSASCAAASRILGGIIDSTLQSGTVRQGWRCVVAQGRTDWAVECSRNRSLIRAYGPDYSGTPQYPQNSLWATAAAKVSMHALAPDSLLGLVVGNVQVETPCKKDQQWLTASYYSYSGESLTIYEGQPQLCGNLGDPPLLAVWHIKGATATLFENCAPIGCARQTGDYALAWSQDGTTILVMASRFGQHDLLAIARSFAIVRG